MFSSCATVDLHAGASREWCCSHRSRRFQSRLLRSRFLGGWWWPHRYARTSLVRALIIQIIVFFSSSANLLDDKGKGWGLGEGIFTVQSVLEGFRRDWPSFWC